MAAVDKDASGWARWLQEQLDERGWQDIEVAKRSGGTIVSSQMTRWLNTERRPDMRSIRKVCAVLGVRPVEGMIAAGYLDPDDIGATIRQVDPDALTDRELIDELARRLDAVSGERPTSIDGQPTSPSGSRPYVVRPVGQEGQDWAARRRQD